MKTHYMLSITPTRVAIADLTEIKAGQLYEINRINVPWEHRGKGYGRQLLNQILESADRINAALVLYPQPGGQLTRDQLIAWYTKNGFIDACLFMLRLPAK